MHSTVYDDLTITIQPLPVVNAGQDGWMCYTQGTPIGLFTINVTSLLNRELKPPRQVTTSESITGSSLHTAPSKESNAWSVPLFSKEKYIDSMIFREKYIKKLYGLLKEKLGEYDIKIHVLTKYKVSTKSFENQKKNLKGEAFYNNGIQIFINYGDIHISIQIWLL
jgi:hypothetical protein